MSESKLPPGYIPLTMHSMMNGTGNNHLTGRGHSSGKGRPDNGHRSRKGPDRDRRNGAGRGGSSRHQQRGGGGRRRDNHAPRDGAVEGNIASRGNKRDDDNQGDDLPE